MDFDISNHAVLRYIERKGGFQLESEARAELEHMVANSTPCDFKDGDMLLSYGEWRMIADMEKSVIVTVFKGRKEHDDRLPQ